MVFAGPDLHYIPDGYRDFFRLIGDNAVAQGDDQNLVAAVAVPSGLGALLKVNHAGIEKVAAALRYDRLPGAVDGAAVPARNRLGRPKRYMVNAGNAYCAHSFASSCKCCNANGIPALYHATPAGMPLASQWAPPTAPVLALRQP